ncbi:MAG: hypothetical protein ACXW3S_14845, partial [Rhodoplanes sp.]
SRLPQPSRLALDVALRECLGPSERNSFGPRPIQVSFGIGRGRYGRKLGGRRRELPARKLGFEAPIE